MNFSLFYCSRTAALVLASVRTALKKSGLNRVTTVGHSLGNIQAHSFGCSFFSTPFIRGSTCASRCRFFAIVPTRHRCQYDWLWRAAGTLVFLLSVRNVMIVLYSRWEIKPLPHTLTKISTFPVLITGKSSFPHSSTSLLA